MTTSLLVAVTLMSAVAQPFAMLVAYKFGQSKRSAWAFLGAFMAFDAVYTLASYSLIRLYVNG